MCDMGNEGDTGDEDDAIYRGAASLFILVLFIIFDCVRGRAHIEKELMVRTETASSSSGSSGALNTSSSKKHFELFPLLPIDTSHNILRDIPTT